MSIFVSLETEIEQINGLQLNWQNLLFLDNHRYVHSASQAQVIALLLHPPRGMANKKYQTRHLQALL